MLYIFLCVFLVALVAFWAKWRFANRRLLAMAKQLSGPPALPVLGNALLFMCQPEELINVIHKLIEDYGHVLRFWLGPELNVVVSDPDAIKILLTSSKTSQKGPQYKYMADVLGGGILSGSGPTWRRHRKIASPNYGKRAIEGYGDVFNREVDLLLEKFRGVKDGCQFNIQEIIVQTTSYSVCQTLMGLTKEQTMNLPYIQLIIDETSQLYDIVFNRMTKWYLQINPIFRMTRSYEKQNNFIRYIEDFSKKILEHRIERLKTLEENRKIDLMNEDGDCLSNTQLSVIDRFILSQELDAEELIRETFTIFTSSQEASAKITCYILLMMAYHPECQNKLYDEIISVIGERDRPVTDQDLKQMPYLEMVFKEVLRLFPIGAMLQRTVTEDIAIDSGTLPAGCSLVVPVYHIHRHPSFWIKPEDFNPERFTPENTKLRHPNCYIPFSLGYMDCLGRYFGPKLIKTICVRVLQEFKISSLETYKDLRLSIAVSVASVNGYQAIFTQRK